MTRGGLPDYLREGERVWHDLFTFVVDDDVWPDVTSASSKIVIYFRFIAEHTTIFMREP
jgi:hypothetical protein